MIIAAINLPFHMLSSMVMNVPNISGITPMKRHQFRRMPPFFDCDVSATMISHAHCNTRLHLGREVTACRKCVMNTPAAKRKQLSVAAILLFFNQVAGTALVYSRHGICLSPRSWGMRMSTSVGELRNRSSKVSGESISAAARMSRALMWP